MSRPFFEPVLAIPMCFLFYFLRVSAIPVFFIFLLIEMHLSNDSYILTQTKQFDRCSIEMASRSSVLSFLYFLPSFFFYFLSFHHLFSFFFLLPAGRQLLMLFFRLNLFLPASWWTAETTIKKPCPSSAAVLEYFAYSALKIRRRGYLV